MKNIVRFHRPYHSWSCKATRGTQSNGFAVKCSQTVAYDLTISVFVTQCFWREQ